MNRQNGLLEEIYHRYRRELFACALAVTRNSERAEDAIQDAFYRLFRQRRIPRNPKAYVFRAVRNAAIDLLRKRPTAEQEVPESLFDPADGPQDFTERREFQRRVETALHTLSEDERETILQHLYADLTFQEIADLRDTPIGTVTAWYRRGLEKLRTRLENR